MIGRAKAVWMANSAIRAYERGDVQTALQKIEAARRAFDSQENSPLKRGDLGRLYQLAGQVYMQDGQTEQALRSFAAAEELLSRDRSNAEDYGRAMHDAALFLEGMGMVKIGMLYLDKAEEAVGHLPAYREQVQRLRRQFAAIADGRAVTPELIATMRADLAAARNADERAINGYNLGVALIDNDSPTDRDEAFDLVRGAIGYFRTRDPEKFVDGLSVLGDSRQRGRRFPSWLDEATDAALGIANGVGSDQLIAAAHLYRAAYLLSVGRSDESLDHALYSIARNNEASLAAESSIVRLFTNMGGEAAREIALIVACERGDADLAAELLESARLQVLPVRSSADQRRSYGGQSTTGVLTTFGSGRTSPIHPIAVNGRSRLAGRYRSDRVGIALDFAEFVSRVGGSDAWWWGAWGFNERLYWCVHGGGVAQCGYLDMTDDTDAGQTFQELLDASPVNAEASRDDILDGPMCASYRHEEALMVRLGGYIVPPVLQAALQRHVRAPEPLSLVVSGTLFAVVPTALLGIERLSVDRYPARLIEAAVLRLAPPAALVAHVDAHPVHPVDQLAVSVACVDPTNELPHARGIPAGTDVVVTEPVPRAAGTPRTVRATAANLVRELQALGPSHPSLFYYSGHAGGDGDMESGLALADGALEAGHIFTAGPHGPVVPFPARALLAACSSSGAGGAGAGEWFGLSAAILWAGARQVIATNWKVWDTPFTARFDRDLAQALRTPTDVAKSLRQAQLTCLAEWRSLPPGRSVGERPLPVTWASYSCIGTYW